MIPGQTPDVAAMEQFQALVGAGIVAHQVAQVQDGLHPLPVDLGQDAVQGFPIAMNISDKCESHKRFPAGGVVRGGANFAAASPGADYFCSNQEIFKEILYHTDGNVTTRASKDCLLTQNRKENRRPAL